jgi:hypothetical protein
MHFFMPHAKNDPADAEERWRHHCEVAGVPVTNGRVYRLVYEHEGDRYEVVVGGRRQVYKRKTGPRGGYLKNAGLRPNAIEVGSVVSTIVDGGGLFFIWSYTPTQGWANPSMVGQNEVISIEYFEPVSVGGDANSTAAPPPANKPMG